MSKTHSPFWHPHGVYITKGAYTTNTKFRKNCLANNIAVESGDVWKRFFNPSSQVTSFGWEQPHGSTPLRVLTSMFEAQTSWLWVVTYQLGHHSATQPLPVFSQSCCEGSRQWVNKLEDVLKEFWVWGIALVSEAELCKWLDWLKLACWKMEPASG